MDVDFRQTARHTVDQRLGLLRCTTAFETASKIRVVSSNGGAGSAVEQLIGRSRCEATRHIARMLAVLWR
jgi:hypothetical protein